MTAFRVKAVVLEEVTGVQSTTVSGEAWHFQITIQSSASTGTFTFEARPYVRLESGTITTPFEPIYKDSTEVDLQVIDLSTASRTFVLKDYFLDSVKVTPSDLNTVYTVIIQQQS